MRVRLSYSVEIDEVLEEAAKILSLQTPNLQEMLHLFNSIPKELNGAEEKAPNVHTAVEMVGEFRSRLVSLDTRLEEVVQIIEGYESYKRGEPIVEPEVAPVKPPKKPQKKVSTIYREGPVKDDK